MHVQLMVLIAVVGALVSVVRGAGGEGGSPVGERSNEFAFKLYGQLRSGEGNLFFSPFSVSTALAMTAQGAQGATAEQMNAVLGLRGEDHAATGTLLKELNGEAGKRGYELAVANALWGQKGYGFRKTFIDASEKNYGAGLNEVDFKGETELARVTINGWVEKQTHEKIKELIKPGMLDGMTRLVLTNAVYFKGNWAVQFKKELTQDGPFYGPGKEMKVPMMHQSGEFRFAQDGRVKMLELPYVKNELSMVLLLPVKRDGLGEVEKTLAVDFPRMLGQLQPTEELPVAIPKFKLTCEYALNEALQSMGMGLPFGERADFSKMASEEKLYISAVVHKAFVDVNEEGTEAAAATGIMMRATAMRVEVERPEFRADHPFWFAIRDLKSGAILFMGRVAQP